MIVMCHKSAQINNIARMSCDTIYLTTYNGPDLFKNFNEIYKCEQDFCKITSELNSNIIIVQMDWQMNFVMV